MEKIFTIKNTALQKAGKQYLQILADGGNIPNPVIIQEERGSLYAYLDGDAIGMVKGISKEEMPKKYEAHLTGLENATTFTAILTSDAVEKTCKDFSKESEAISKEGGLSKEEIDAVAKYMTEQSITPDVIKVILETYGPVASPERYVPAPGEPLYQNVRDEGLTPYMQFALKRAVTGRAVNLIGEKSTGKGVLHGSIAYVCFLPKYVITCQADMTIDDFFGGKGTDNSAAESLTSDLAKAKIKVEFKPETATEEDYEKAAQFELLCAQAASIHIVQNEAVIIKWAKEGGVLLFDEINMASANILQSVMHPMADGTKSLVIPGVGAIKLNSKCILMSAMNPPNYEGTRRLNEATKSRMGHIIMDVPETIKPQLMANFREDTVLDKKYFNACDLIYKSFVELKKSEKISNDALNIRGFVSALKVVEMFPESSLLAEEIEIDVINGVEDTNEIPILQQVVRDKIAL